MKPATQCSQRARAGQAFGKRPPMRGRRMKGYVEDRLTGSTVSIRASTSTFDPGHAVLIVRAKGALPSRRDTKSIISGFWLAASAATMPTPRFLPDALAWYSAASARAIDSSAQIASNAPRLQGYAAHPTEHVFVTVIPWPRSNGSDAITSSTRLQNAGVPDGSVERLMIRNSSPPQRTSTSDFRTTVESRCATSCSNRSPAG